MQKETLLCKVFERNLVVDSLYFNSGVFLGNNRELDSNIAALSSSQEAFLQNNSLQSQIPFPSILLTSLTIGNVDPSVPFLLITITKPHSMVGLTSCVSANIFSYKDQRCSDGRTADSLTPIWILQSKWPRCFWYAWEGQAELCCHYRFRLSLVARDFKLFIFTNDSAPNVISVVFERFLNHSAHTVPIKLVYCRPAQ